MKHFLIFLMAGALNLLVLVWNCWAEDFDYTLLPDGHGMLLVWAAGTAFFFFMAGLSMGERSK